MGSEVMLGREPANVADLAEKPGRQHRPHPEPPEQAGVGLDDGCLDTGLHRGDPLLQLADVSDQVRSQLVADDRRLAGGRDRSQLRRGPVGGEVASGATGDQVHRQPVQPVDGLGPGGHQVLAPLGQGGAAGRRGGGGPGEPPEGYQVTPALQL